MLLAFLAFGAAGHPAGAAAESSPAFVAVQRAFIQENFEQVAALAQTFLLEHPDSPETPKVWLWFVFSLDRLQRSQDALGQLEQLKRRLPSGHATWPEVLYWEGDISRRALQLTRAKLAFQQLLDRYPSSTWAVQAQLGLGLVYLQQQVFDAASRHFHVVAERQPEAPLGLEARLFEGLCQLRLGEYPQAVGIFQALLTKIQHRDSVAQAAFYLGESLTGLNRYTEAIQAYQQSLATSDRPPWGPLAQFGVGWAYYRSGQCEQAIPAFDRYLTQGVREHQIEALFAQGSCLVQTGKDDQGLARFEQVVSLAPTHPLACDSGLAVADAYRRQERFALARELLHALLRPNLPALCRAQVQLRLGAISLAEGNTAQATTVFTLAKDGDDPMIQQGALAGLGDVQMFLGNTEEARRWYEQALARSSSGPLAAYAAYQLGRLHLQMGAVDEAVRLFRQVTAEPDSGLADEARLALVIAYLRDRHDDLAQNELDALRQQRAGRTVAGRAAYYAALLALAQGDDAEAARAAQDAAEHAAGTEEAFEAKLLLVDLDTEQAAPGERLKRFERLYETERLPRAQRARVAKRVGDAARAAQDCPTAVHWYEEARRLLPSLGGEAAYWTASCYEEGGDIDLAMKWYGTVLQPPWRVRGQLALAKLLEREGRMAEAVIIYNTLAAEPIPEAKSIRERLSILRATSRTTNR